MVSEPEAGGPLWKGLHPASLLVNLVPMAWRTLRVGWPLLLAMTVGGGLRGLVDLSLFLSFLGLAVARTVVHFLTLRYRVHEGRLHIRSGLVGRTNRVIDPARIQNMELVQNLFHKMAGLVELRIETAGDSGIAGGVEGLLSALSLEEAESLRRELGQHSAHVTETAEAGEAIDAPGLVEVVAYGVSVGRVGSVALAIGFLLDAMGQLPGLGVATPGDLGSRSIMGLVLVALAGGYAVSVGSAILRFYGHRWWKAGRSLHFESGLFTRRRMDIPLAKIQLVRVTAPIMRRWMGYATVLVETAAVGLPGSGGATEGMVPMVATEDVHSRVQHCLPAFDVAGDQPLRPCAPRAVSRATFFGAARWAILATVAHFWLGEGWVWSLVGWGAITGYLDARRQGWWLSEHFVVVRRGFLRRDTWVLPRAKIQSVRWAQSPTMRASDLARVIVWIPGGRLALPDLRATEARQVYEALVAAMTPTARPGAA